VIESQPLKETDGLSQHEIITLCCILENMYGDSDSSAIGSVRTDMEKLGYNQIAMNIGLRKLSSRNLISSREERDFDGNRYLAYKLEEAGWRWVFENEFRLKLKVNRKKAVKQHSSLDDEIPF